MPEDIAHYIIYGVIIVGTYFILKSPKDKGEKKEDKK